MAPRLRTVFRNDEVEAETDGELVPADRPVHLLGVVGGLVLALPWIWQPGFPWWLVAMPLTAALCTVVAVTHGRRRSARLRVTMHRIEGQVGTVFPRRFGFRWDQLRRAHFLEHDDGTVELLLTPHAGDPVSTGIRGQRKRIRPVLEVVRERIAAGATGAADATSHHQLRVLLGRTRSAG
jgi:hypothetical protein